MCLLGDDDAMSRKHFSDRDICRPFLLGICINELFVNTVRIAIPYSVLNFML